MHANEHSSPLLDATLQGTMPFSLLAAALLRAAAPGHADYPMTPGLGVAGYPDCVQTGQCACWAARASASASTGSGMHTPHVTPRVARDTVPACRAHPPHRHERQRAHTAMRPTARLKIRPPHPPRLINTAFACRLLIAACLPLRGARDGTDACTDRATRRRRRQSHVLATPSPPAHFPPAATTPSRSSLTCSSTQCAHAKRPLPIAQSCALRQPGPTTAL